MLQTFSFSTHKLLWLVLLFCFVLFFLSPLTWSTLMIYSIIASRYLFEKLLQSVTLQPILMLLPVHLLYKISTYHHPMYFLWEILKFIKTVLNFNSLFKVLRLFQIDVIIIFSVKVGRYLNLVPTLEQVLLDDSS